MPLAVITGNVWDSTTAPIPAVNEPELWFRPRRAAVGRGLLTDREVPAETFNIATGAFTVKLESAEGLTFMPILRWLKNPEDPRNRARGQAEWAEFHPDTGGVIDDLIAQYLGVGLVYCASDAPNPSYRNQLHFDTDTQRLYERVVTW